MPIDIILDGGPLFISQDWKACCNASGATVSLSSSFHPQTNGQAERANQISGRCWGTWRQRTLRCGMITSPGLNMHTNLSPLLPVVCVHLSGLWDICLLCFRPRNATLQHTSSRIWRDARSCIGCYAETNRSIHCSKHSLHPSTCFQYRMTDLACQ